MELTESVRFIKGIGDKRAELLAKLGIFTLGDLVNHYPRDYENRGNTVLLADAMPGDTVSVILTVATAPTAKLIRKGLSITKLSAFDETGVCHITFFNQPYAKSAYSVGSVYRFYGKIDGNFIKKEMTNPFAEAVKEGKPLCPFVPVYPLTEGITQSFLRGAIRQAMQCIEFPETLPGDMLSEYSLVARDYALRQIHFPDTAESLDKAKSRLAFDELLIFRLGLTMLKSRSARKTDIYINGTLYESGFYRLLPFAPTGAQRRVIGELAADMASGQPMTRLVQGDVGSGKTAVAAAAMYMCVKSGYQAIMMAPTEILARQHYAALTELFSARGIKVGLIVGGMKASEKKSVLADCKSGEIQIAVGTHALIQSDTDFAKVGLVVADEQHRFGVMQRAALSDKGNNPHTLIMSATPIPRTLALIVYGDLNVSALDEMPPGRQKIDTFAVDDTMRERIYAFIAKLVREGGQAYIVCPLIEDDEGGSNMKDVISYAKELDEKVFPTLTTAFLHGKLKASEKERIMEDFASGKTNILISTTVIEVGVNVPNAVLMVVENAERFGLSQLHQLRGRVGRGKKKSYCVLFSNSKSEKTQARLSAMVRTNDGFEIAKADLEQRGPGDFFGYRQHGLAAFRLADILQDPSLLMSTQSALDRIIAESPTLESGRFAPLLPEIKRLFTIGGSENIFN